MSERPTQLAVALASEERKLLACVHCGLCLEACPTYVQTGDENDGPRGRIYLMRAVEEGRLAAESRAFQRHIERCLGCRACESACPSGVEYGQLLEAARSDIAGTGRGRGWTSKLLRLALRHVWLHPARLRAAFASARVLRDSRLPRFLLKTKLTKLLPSRVEFALALLDSSSPTPLRLPDEDSRTSNGVETNASGANVRGVGANVRGAGVQSADAGDAFAANGVSSKSKGETAALLFEGCVTEGLFSRVNRATARVLEANGCSTCAPRGQVCCGALHAHAGDLEGARRLARANIEAFERAGDAPVVTNAGGCGAMLVSYAQLLAHDESFAERAREFSARVRDVSQQLAATGIREGVPLDDIEATYDASCHLIHGQRAQAEPLRMLGAVEGLRLTPLEGSDVCCGGAGVYNLLESELSSRILEEKLRHVGETGARFLATGNPGCHMQIGAGVRLRGLGVRVCHPVELLDESYRRAGLYERS
ncbi:MAG TPA: heterodisulfide reductase-related iron-sulfur binding cluster [Pyrinomonadaceae bacterium]|nr:heterodisulfide reductase-related iron-sulfur binding cluster [Pyrinomonadaceae bacterium]